MPVNLSDREALGSCQVRNAVSRALHSRIALVNAGYKRAVAFIEGASGSCRRGLH